MILVTGAAGKTGRAIIRRLVDRGRGVRAFVRTEEQRKDLLALGAQQTMLGDLSNRDDIEQALEGIGRVYHICPNVDPSEVEYAELMIEASVRAGVRQFGYHSVLHSQTESMPHHWRKLRVEELLFESGLPFSIMQPCAYMQNLLSQQRSLMNEGVIRLPYSTKAKFSLVDLEDVAAAVAAVLSEPCHLGAIYELAGPEILDHEQVAAMISAELGQPVRAEQIGLAEWERTARSAGMGDYQISALLSMFNYYERSGFWGNSNVLAFLLGRRPMSFEGFLRREFSALVGR